MIWHSFLNETAIDLLIIAGALYCYLTHRKLRRRSAQAGSAGSATASRLLVLGIAAISLVFLGDLLALHALPFVLPRIDAEAFIENLHLHYAWVAVLAGLALIITGFILTNANLLSVIGRLERSEMQLRRELGTRLEDQSELNISKAGLADAQRLARVGSWTWNLVTDEVRWSDEFFRICGRDPDHFGATYDAFLETVHPEDRQLVDDAITTAIHDRKPYSVDHRIALPGGGEKVVHAQGESVYGEDGKPLHMSGTMQDITARNAIENVLRTAEQRFRDFAEASSDWFWEIGPDLRFTWVSDRLAERSGFPLEHFIGKTSRELGPPSSNRAEWEHYLRQLDAHEPVRGFYFKRLTADGSERHFRLSGKPVFAADGTFMGYRGAGREFTDEADAEERLERVRDQFLNAMEYISEGLALFDADERLVMCNSQFREFVIADTIAAPIGTRFEELVQASVRAGRVSVPEQMTEEWIAWRVERFRDPGEPFELVVDGRHLLIHEKRLPEGGTIYVNADITEIKEREEQLRQAQKMEVVGQMTGGVAHDFNNVLAVISGNLELLGERLGDNEEHQEFVRKCLDAAERGSTLTQRLLAFSRKQPLMPQAIDVAALMRDLPSLLHRTLGEDIAIEIAVPDDLSTVFADPGQLENAILNLAVNARDAMPGGGRLTIAAANRTIGEEESGRPAQLTPGDYVMITVSDTGTGMSPEVVEKAFEPFFTTKPMGKGSGLGLSMVFGFSRQSRGDVVISSEIGRGTSVRMFLPGSDAAAAETRGEDRGTIVRGKGESILVVEDDPAVRELAVDLLNSLNYHVISANDGPDALDIMDAVSQIDLLFTDVVLPKAMDGVELARRAVSKRPGLKVLYTSGYTEGAFRGSYAGPDGLDLLNKQYHKAALARSIRDALDQPMQM